MKKLLLILSFLASQLFAVQCTEEQYKPYFDLKNTDRYIPSYTQTTDHSLVVIDKKSIIYDKVNQKIKCWVIYQDFEGPKYGKFKALWEFNLKNNQNRAIESTGYNCAGNPIHSESTTDWFAISPNTGGEYILNNLKEYLNIK